MTKQQYFNKLMKAFIEANNKPYNPETQKDNYREYAKARDALVSYVYQNRDNISIGSNIGKTVMRDKLTSVEI